MTPKQKLYFSLTERLAPLWEQDRMLMITDTDLWKQRREESRIIEDWLHDYLDDDRVSYEQFERNCDRLLALYRL